MINVDKPYSDLTAGLETEVGLIVTFYLPREFSSIVITSVYISPQADTSLALSNLHDVLSGYNNKHPDAAFIIAGDFNKANLKKVLPNFHQHISCPTRGLNTLDHCYTPLKNAYKAHSLPAFGKSDHVAIFLTPEYKQRIVHESPVEREVTRWSSHSEAMLQASLDDIDWDMFRASSSDVSEFTDVALSFVNTLTEQATETVTIRTFSNHFQLNDSRRMWQGLKTICSSGNGLRVLGTSTLSVVSVFTLCIRSGCLPHTDHAPESPLRLSSNARSTVALFGLSTPITAIRHRCSSFCT